MSNFSSLTTRRCVVTWSNACCSAAGAGTSSTSPSLAEDGRQLFRPDSFLATTQLIVKGRNSHRGDDRRDDPKERGGRDIGYVHWLRHRRKDGHSRQRSQQEIEHRDHDEVEHQESKNRALVPFCELSAPPEGLSNSSGLH